MASDLISIARSGTQTARAALDVTAQNIANAATQGYVRRSAQLEEVAFSGSFGQNRQATLAGVRLGGVVRNVDAFRQAEMRRTGSDAARAGSEVTGLQAVEAAIEQAGVHPAIVGFEASLQQLAADPTNTALRAAVIAGGQTMSDAFNLAARALDAAGETVRFAAADGAARVNVLTGDLARVNEQLARSAAAMADQSPLLDRRDMLLEELSGYVGIDATIATDRTVSVQIAGGGPALVSGFTSQSLAFTTAADGTIAFTVGGSPAALAGGALAGDAQALVGLAGSHAGLDALAGSIITVINAAQANGAALDGSAGQAMFAGTGAGDIMLAFNDGAMIAAAPAGAGPQSRDSSNLAALRIAMTNADPAGQADALLFGISASIAGRMVTRDALDTIAASARDAVNAQAGVDLDNEAVNLVRFQQAFQASGRVMQVASDLFDTLLAIR